MGRRTTLKRNLEKIERNRETYSNHYLVVLYIYSCEKMYAFPNLAICRYSNFAAPPEGSDYGFLRSVISPCEQGLITEHWIRLLYTALLFPHYNVLLMVAWLALWE